MACNVYLTFFHKYNSEQLRQLEWKYATCCYGVPFIPAFAYFFIKTESLGRVYGSAIVSTKTPTSSPALSTSRRILTFSQLWCWVSREWDWLRIAVFYGPVWLIIILTFAIYLRAGSVIYQKRRQFRNIGNADSLDSETQAESPLIKLAGIQVTSEIACSGPERRSLTPSDAALNRSFSSNFSPYSVTIQGGQSDPTGIFQGTSASLVPARPSSSRLGPSPLRSEIRASHPDRVDVHSQRRSVTTETSSAAWAYTKYAMLFFIALLVTWVCSLLMMLRVVPLIANFKMQVPSTVNRVYALARPDDFSFGLNFASSFVLPLQGFWNSLIYISISWPAFKTLWRDFKRGSPTLQKIVQ